MDESVTRKTAALARLALEPDEVREYTAQLSQVLAHIEQLKEVSLVCAGQEVEPMTHPLDHLDLTTALREDLLVESPVDVDGRPKVLTHAPDVLDDGYKVPPVL